MTDKLLVGVGVGAEWRRASPGLPTAVLLHARHHRIWLGCDNARVQSRAVGALLWQLYWQLLTYGFKLRT